jgi:hypothetical protein
LQNITFRESTGNSSYNALWITANKRLSRGLQFNASYTFSKSIDYNSQSSQGVTLQDSNNIKGDRGLSDFDARHRFVISGLYELPWKKDSVLGGWQFSAIVQSQSGNPVTLLAGNAGAIAGGAPAANANSLTGLATLRPDIGAPITISPVAGHHRQRRSVVSQSGVRSKARRIMSGRRRSDFAGGLCQRQEPSITSAVSGATR